MNRILAALVGACIVAGCQPNAAAPDSSAPASTLNSGIELTGMDQSVRPQDDFFAYANGGWIASTEIPPDQAGWGSFNILYDNSLKQLQTIIEEASDAADSESGAKIGNFYNAWMNVDRVNALGISPLANTLAEIDRLESHDDVAAFFGSSNELGLDARSICTSVRTSRIQSATSSSSRSRVSVCRTATTTSMKVSAA